MDENILTWNFTNWITISIMAGLTLLLAGAAQSKWRQRQSGS